VSAAIDHLVVAAASLDQGVDWCEQVLGVTPAPGGQHVGMGTHNRLLSIGSAAFPKTYLEIIAIDPAAPKPKRPYWFGLDQPALQARLRQGPKLVHAVARCDALDAMLARLAGLGVDAGRALAAERANANGVLRWRIAVREDSQLLHGGALPTLIEWGEQHPSAMLPASPVGLTALSLGGLPAPVGELLSLQGVPLRDGGAALIAELDTPRGRVRLSSDD
jgi:Glyoxalase-like domain